MPSDAWADLNRRAAAVPGFQIAPEHAGMHVTDDSGATGIVVVQGPRWVETLDRQPEQKAAIGDRVMVWRPGYGLTATTGWVPDLRSPATRGILRAALGSPSVLFHDGRYAGGDVRCRIRDVAGYGTTREQAEAAALVALAEARGQWGPG